MSWDDAVLYNDYEGMKECYAKLKEENKQLQNELKEVVELNSDEITKKLTDSWYKSEVAKGGILLEHFEQKQKLEAIRDLAEKALEGYASITGAYWERTEALEKIVALCDSAQNTDYVQKEKTQNVE